MEKILVSACLLGENCKYNGESNYCQAVVDFFRVNEKAAEAVTVCPEVMGGLSTPRTPAEIRGKTVITKDGRDVTAEYEEGALKAAALARELDCRQAILKERSPSCGCGQIYDGTFEGRLVPGDGKTAGVLKRMGIRVYGESEALGLMEH